MFPGDTVRIPIDLTIDMTGGNVLGDTEGTISVQFEFRTRFPLPAPEPSAALTLPIGAAWLAGMAAMKGGV